MGIELYICATPGFSSISTDTHGTQITAGVDSLLWLQLHKHTLTQTLSHTCTYMHKLQEHTVLFGYYDPFYERALGRGWNRVRARKKELV